MGAMRLTVMLLAGFGLLLGATGCGHFRDDEDDDRPQKAYDQIGEVRVYDERPNTPAVRPDRAAAAPQVHVAASRPAQRYDQIGEADLQE